VTPFEKFSEEVRAWLNWYGMDSAKLPREDLWRAYAFAHGFFPE
jgi:hypothetical protein